MKTFAVLQLSSCAGCEVSLLDSDAWLGQYQLLYMPLVISSHDVPPVDLLLVSGGVRSEQDLYNLRRAVRSAGQVVAVGTCAISGGVASLGDRDQVRQRLRESGGRFQVPHLLPRCGPIDAVVAVDLYLPGCPPTPELFMALLSGDKEFKTNRIVCAECGRKKKKELRPTSLAGFHSRAQMPEICLVKQGHLCLGSVTRNGCGAPCPKAGFPCVGCRGPSDKLIEKESGDWLDNIRKVFSVQTDILAEEIDQGLRSPRLSMFLFQFSDHQDDQRPRRGKDQVI